MKLRIKNNAEKLENIIELLGNSEKEIEDFITKQKLEIIRINKTIKQVTLAGSLLKKHFGFVTDENGRKEIVNICERFPEIETPKQVEVVFYMLKGLSGKQIAEQMRTCEKTVKFHKTNIYKSTSVKSQSELIAYYYENKTKPVNENVLPVGNVETLNA
jgi:DNA-binding NarL/FixJ family response regulator